MTIATIFSLPAKWNGQDARNFDVRFNSQALPPGAQVHIQFTADGQHSGCFPYSAETVPIMVCGQKVSYEGLFIFQSQIRAQVMGTVCL